MKQTVLLALAIVMCASLAFGQDTIGMFSDGAGTNCSISIGGSFGTVYFWHHLILAPGATQAQFKVVEAGGTVATEIGGFVAASGASAAGTTKVGITVAYGGCKSSNFYLGSQLYQFSPLAPCSRLDVVADPSLPSGQIETRDCTPAAAVVIPYASGHDLRVQWSLGFCGPFPDCLPIPTAERTWGQIKALYN